MVRVAPSPAFIRPDLMAGLTLALLHDRPPPPTSPPCLSYHRRIYAFAGRRRDDPHAGAGMARNLSGVKLARRGVHLGPSPDGPYEAPGRSRPRSGVAGGEKCPLGTVC